MKYSSLSIRSSLSHEKDRLFQVWKASVEATHDFLSKEDISQIGLQVQEYVANCVFVVAVNEKDDLLGFMGMTENKVDSLFIDPEYFGMGIGKQLIAHASSLHSHLYVDVNEDNIQAKLFYEKMGFTTYERSELDDEGRPFPILKMKL